jgi:hypothetical protein
MCITYINIQKLCISHTECSYKRHMVFRVNANYFPKQHKSIDLCNGDAL